LAVAGCQVGMLVALVQPRVEVSSQTAWCNGARFHAFLERLELAEQLCASRNVKSFVDADYFH